MSACVKFTKFIHDSGALTKRIFLKDGKVAKEASANFSKGRFETISVGSAQELGDYINTLKTNEALGYGMCVKGVSGLVATDKKRQGDEVARTRKFFAFPAGQPGILCLDYDAPKEGSVFSRDELIGILDEVAPGITSASWVWLPSAGSCILRDGEELIGIRGQRILAFVDDASDIPRAGKALIDRLWLSGRGEISLSASGSMLERTIFDGCVWAPEHLDFIGGSVVEAPLTQDRGDPVVHEGGFADTRHCLPDLSEVEATHVAELQQAAKHEKEPEAKAVRVTWSAKRASELVVGLIGSGISEVEARERAEAVIAQVHLGVLLGDWPRVSLRTKPKQSGC